MTQRTNMEITSPCMFLTPAYQEESRAKELSAWATFMKCSPILKTEIIGVMLHITNVLRKKYTEPASRAF